MRFDVCDALGSRGRWWVILGILGNINICTYINFTHTSLRPVARTTKIYSRSAKLENNTDGSVKRKRYQVSA